LATIEKQKKMFVAEVLVIWVAENCLPAEVCAPGVTAAQAHSPLRIGLILWASPNCLRPD
jgi:hypothetical protein